MSSCPALFLFYLHLRFITETMLSIIVAMAVIESKKATTLYKSAKFLCLSILRNEMPFSPVGLLIKHVENSDFVKLSLHIVSCESDNRCSVATVFVSPMILPLSRNSETQFRN